MRSILLEREAIKTVFLQWFGNPRKLQYEFSGAKQRPPTNCPSKFGSPKTLVADFKNSRTVPTRCRRVVSMENLILRFQCYHSFCHIAIQLFNFPINLKVINNISLRCQLLIFTRNYLLRKNHWIQFIKNYVQYMILLKYDIYKINLRNLKKL